MYYFGFVLLKLSPVEASLLVGTSKPRLVSKINYFICVAVEKPKPGRNTLELMHPETHGLVVSRLRSHFGKCQNCR